jgi:hypothetical protein
MQSNPSNACARCATPYGLAWHEYRRVDLPFCQACWRRYVTARRVFAVAVVVAVLVLAGAAVLAVAARDYAPAIVGALVALAALLPATLYFRSSRPR